MILTSGRRTVAEPESVGVGTRAEWTPLVVFAMERFTGQRPLHSNAQKYQNSNLATETEQNEGNEFIFVIYALILLIEFGGGSFFLEFLSFFFFVSVERLSGVGVWVVIRRHTKYRYD